MMRRDAATFKFLVDKKIAQLVKLINHLSGELEDRKYQTEQAQIALNLQFSEIENRVESSIRESTKVILSNESSFTKQVRLQHEARLKDVQRAHSSAINTIKSSLTDIETKVYRETSTIQQIITDILSKLDGEAERIGNSMLQLRAQCEKRVISMNKEHKDQIRAINADSQQKLDQLQAETSRKLDELERDFNKTFMNLRDGFGASTNDADVAIEKARGAHSIASHVQSSIESWKEEIATFLEQSKQTTKDTKAHVFDVIRVITSDEESRCKDKKLVQQELDESEQRWNSEKEHLNREFEMQAKLRMDRISMAQRELDEVRRLIEEEGKKARGGLKQSVRQQSDDVGRLRQNSKDEIDAEQAKLQLERNEIEREIERLLTALQELTSPIELEEKKLNEAIEMHQKERGDVEAGFRLEIEKERELFATLRGEAITAAEVENLRIRKEIEENSRILEDLTNERDELMTQEEDIKNLKEELAATLDELKTQQEMDMKALEEDEMVIIAASKSEKERIQSDYRQQLQVEAKTAMENIDISFESFEKTINDEYEEKMRNLTNELELLPEVVPVVFQEVENEEVMARSKEIESERQKLIDDYVSQQKLEENRHLREMAAIDFMPRQKEDTKAVQEQHQLQMEKMKIEESECQSILAEEIEKRKARENELKRITDDFDLEQKQLENKLAEAENRSKISIEAGEESLTVAKQSLIGQIKDLEEKISNAKSKELESNGGIQEAASDAEDTLKNIQERHNKSVEKETKLHNCEMEVRVLRHRESLKEWQKSITSQKVANLNALQHSEADSADSQAKLESLLTQNESQNRQDLEEIKRKGAESAALLDEIITQKTRALNEVKEKVEAVGRRTEEITKIEYLENALKLQTTHLTELSKDLVLCKKQMVAQEDVYNSRFGTPNIAVLRPQTAISTSIPGGRSRARVARTMQRPFTSPGGARPILLTHTRV